MVQFFALRQPVARVTRITLAVLVGWWLVKNLASAQLPTDIEWPNTDFDKRSVEMSEIMSGGPPKDGIPSIDNPRFLSVEKATAEVNPREPVVAVALGGEARAYPLSILIWHEIVNDELGGQPITVTFCPLCNATVVYDRRVGDKVLDFGTTGRLRKSDMVMYDRQTESWWQQFTGVGIVGEMTGVTLMQVPAGIIAFEDFAAAHPAGKVLSRDTGQVRSYGSTPYRGYDDINNVPFLFSDPIDSRLPAMERVLNISLNDVHRLYPFQIFENTPVINDQIGDTPIVVMSKRGTLSVLDASDINAARTIPSATAYSRSVGGETLMFERRDGAIVDIKTSSHWNLLGRAIDGPLAGTQLSTVPSGVHFAFAWLAFRPDSQIYTAKK
jgi:hypothetical protein